jgi:hypothetical protein
MSEDTTTQPSAVYEIPESNLARFKEKFDHLMRRGRKLGTLDLPGYQVGESQERKVTETDLDGENYTYWITVYPVTVWGTAPKLQGWSFVATADYAEGSEPIFRSALISGERADIPEHFRTMGPRCGHCKKIRNRRETFILKHDSGEFIQVGRTCLKDFLGHQNPEAIASLAELIRDISAACRDLSEGGDVDASPSVETYLAWVCRMIGEFGWLPKSKADDDDFSGSRISTAVRALGAMGDNREAVKKGIPAKFKGPTEQDKETAKAALIWAQNLGQDGATLSDYEHNLRAASKRQGLGKNAGIIASIIPAWHRIQERKLAGQASGWLGQPGERLRDLIVVVDRAIDIPGGMYGDSILFLMHDQTGNRITWKSSSRGLDVGATYKITGTVDKKRGHDEYKGTKQTRLTRCVAEKVTFAPEKTAA